VSDNNEEPQPPADFSDSDSHGARTRDWFAEGVNAEEALRSLSSTSPLPAIYSDVSKSPHVSRRHTWLIWGPVLLALIALGVIICRLIA